MQIRVVIIIVVVALLIDIVSLPHVGCFHKILRCQESPGRENLRFNSKFSLRSACASPVFLPNST